MDLQAARRVASLTNRSGGATACDVNALFAVTFSQASGSMERLYMNCKSPIIALFVSGVAIALVAVTPSAARGAAIQITSSELLSGPGMATLTYTSTQDLLPSPLVLTTIDNTVTFALAQGDWRRANQYVNFFGDFNPGTHLLYTNNNNFLGFDLVTSVGGGGSGPVEIAFSQGVEAVGIRAQTAARGPETFTFSVYNNAIQLGTFTADGISDRRANEEFTVLLAAAATDDDVITRLVISSVVSTTAGTQLTNNFVVGPLTFGTPGQLPVPETSTAILTTIGLGMLASRLRRRGGRREYN
jgi:hypothetical protein